MSTPALAPLEAPGVALRCRQASAVMRLELARSFADWRSLWLLVLAFWPALVVTAHGIQDLGHRLEGETLVLAGIVQFYYARFAIFFGCLGISLRLFRGEVAEKTLHYPFLAPLRREVLLIGKFLSGVVTAVALFGAGILACFLLMYGHSAAGRDFVLNGAGRGHLGAYLLVVALACLGYSALFLALGLLLKSPAVPAALLLLWEIIHPVLPAWLQLFSVTFHLKPLFPVGLPLGGVAGLFGVVTEPTPARLAVAGVVAFAGFVLAFACWRIRSFEISYSTD